MLARLVLLAALGLTALLLAACNGGGGEPTKPAGDEPSPTASPAVTATAEATPTPTVEEEVSEAYRASGGASVVLDETAAYQAAVEYLRAEGGLAYSVVTRPARVEVSVSRRASTGFLRVVGINGVDISASATAEPRHGVASAGP